MHHAFLDIKGVRTNVLTYGRWVEESAEKMENNLILIIPGNPGITGFYKLFMKTLHERTGYPVWIISHAGHEIPKNDTVDPVPRLGGNETKYTLQAQVEHKREFIQKYVPDNAKIHFVGHSIGSYIILELLQDESIKKQVESTDLLFPTIEHMADTPNGKFMSTYVKPILSLILFLAMVFSILPRVISNFLMYIYMTITFIPKLHFGTMHSFINPAILEKVFFMAYDELDTVKERNNKAIKENLDKLRLLYGTSDGWVPTKLCNRLKNDYKDMRAELMPLNHAFVLKQSTQVGMLVSDWILGKK